MRQRFTLVEMLVVMAIVGVLSAILLGVVAQARAKGRQSACLGQLRQLGIAIHLYVQDHDDKLPMVARLGPDSLYQLPSLRQALDGYGATAELFHCPADHDDLPLFQDVGTSYEWNTLLSGRKIDRTTLSIIGMQLRTPMLGDAESWHPNDTRNLLWPDGHVASSLEGLIE